MKKLIIIVTLITGMVIATQAQFQITVNPAPTAFEMSLDGNAIILSGSQVGVSYQLYMDEDGKSMSVGDPIQGTGRSIIFEVDTEGEYTAVGFYDTIIECQTDMTGAISYTGDKPTVEYSTDGGKTWIVVDKEAEISDGAMIRVYHGEAPIPEKETDWDISSYVAILIFLLVIIPMIYGIINRKKISFGDHKEMKAPFTGTIRRKR